MPPPSNGNIENQVRIELTIGSQFFCEMSQLKFKSEGDINSVFDLLFIIRFLLGTQYF